MDDHLIRNIPRRSKRQLNMDEVFLSPSLHHIHHRKQARLIKPDALNQNRFLSSRLQTSSYTSLNSYLKEFNLSEKEFFELQQAFKTIFNSMSQSKQYLTSPYLQQNNHQLLFPLYTNEYFIRNGLLNHNDGPDLHLQSSSSSSSPSSTILKSSANISLPLALLSNHKYLFTALTSNFTSEISRRSMSNMELNMIKSYEKYCDQDETESMRIRRYKVQTWERENVLQKTFSTTSSSIQQLEQTSQYHRCSTIRTSSIINDDRTLNITEESTLDKSISLTTSNKLDNLFPMVKVLAPYIIIRDAFHLNSTLSSTQHRSLFLPSSPIMKPTDQIPKDKQVQNRKTNYLLAEFESVLTQISKKQLL